MKYHKNGYIAIITLLIIMAVVTAVLSTTTLLSINEAQSSLVLFKGQDTLSFVEGCAQDALYKARSNPGYTGGTITRPLGTCIITIDSIVGTTWTLTATTQETQYKRSIQVTFIRLPTGITLQGWKEL